MDILKATDYVLVKRTDLDALIAQTQQPSPPATNSHLLRVSEVAARLTLSRSEIYRLIESGDLPSVTFGRAIRVHPDDLQRIIDQQRPQ